MQASDLVEVLCAAHLSYHVQGPFRERGGIMIVGPPGVLKTTFVSVLDRQYQDALMVSDINVKTLIRMRDAIAAGKVNTLVLPELAKLYERQEVTSSNVEGTLRAMVAEGFASASFEDHRINRLKAHALVIGALTPSTQTKYFSSWEETGFNRRFLWSLIRLKDASVVERAAINWTRLNFRLSHVPLPPLEDGGIPNLTSVRERQRIAVLVKHQPGGDHAIQIQLLTRVLAVLRWWYEQSGDIRDPMDTVERFGESLGKDGAAIDVGRPPSADTLRERELLSHSAGRTLAQRRWRQEKKRKRTPVKKRPPAKRRKKR